jgi:hypothetical protein
MPGDNWAGPSYNSPVTAPQFKFGAALFAPEPILCVACDNIAVLHNV